MEMQFETNDGKKPVANRPPRALPKCEVARLLELAAQAKPDQMPLRGQAEAANVLRRRGFGVNAISRWLAANGLPVAPSTICKYFKRLDRLDRENQRPARKKTNL